MFSYSNGVMLISTNWKKVSSQRLTLNSFWPMTQNLSIKNEENNGVLTSVPFLSPSCALQIPPSLFNACYTGYVFIVKSNYWSIINSAFWLVELLLGYMLLPTRSKKGRLWKPKQWQLNHVLLAKVVLSRYFWPSSWILLKKLFLSSSWPLSQ